MILLIGCGGHGRVLLDALASAGTQVDGVLDSSLRIEDRLFGVPVLGDDSYLDGAIAPELVNGIGANPYTGPRRALFERMTAQGFQFRAVRHASAIVGSACVIARGSQIMAGVVLQACVDLGVNSVVNTRASIDHDCVIGAHAFIGPGAILCGHVTVGEGAFIGAGAVILPGVKIGARAIVGAGSVVLHGVAADTMVAGNPIRIIKSARGLRVAGN